MAQSDTVFNLLREGPQPARALYERLGVSQPTLSRLMARQGESILRFGKARQTQYALRRKLGAHADFPLYRVSASGDLQQWGVLYPIMPEGYLVEIRATSTHEARTDMYPGLPWYLQDMRPQGFLGRSFARFHGPMLGLPADPTRWSDDQTLLALANTGYDTPGNLMVGEESASYFQTRVLFSCQEDALTPIPAEQRLQQYPKLARLALAGEVVGSSAGGEQPKFNVEILRAVQSVQVMVKFTAPQDNATTLRWRSLLICEYIASRVLSDFFPCSESELLRVEADGSSQLFLDALRFDRVGKQGRAGVVSLKSLDDEFAGLATDWPTITAALLRAGKLSAAVHQQVQKLYAFGVLIGNADMHTGNLSFFVDDVTKVAPEYTLAPVYDMLPMSLAPRPSGQIPDALPVPKVGVNPSLPVWKEMLPLAIRYWQQVVAHPDISEDVRHLAQKQAGILSQTVT
ncbi:MAG: type II toxin-antitoxin system HipA family toxin YjjJ [Proteobacteria bacterium]|nr:type II toxin-antitoxin system HipA family toxin YjjJ [Pseudomonadota bacterium]